MTDKSDKDDKDATGAEGVEEDVESPKDVAEGAVVAVGELEAAPLEADALPTIPTRMDAAESDAEAETEPEAETELEAESEPEADSEPEAETELEADSEPEADSGPEADSEAEADSEPEAESMKDKAIAGATAALAARSVAETPEPTPSRRSHRKDRTFYVVGFWHRALAAIIDAAVVLPVALALVWISSKITGLYLPAGNQGWIDYWLDLLLASNPALIGGIGLLGGIACLYVLIFQITMGRTPGMMVLKTRIIDIYGDPPSSGRAVARTAGYVAGVATLSLGFLWIGFDNEKRGLHDWLSGTYVVKG